MLIGIDLDNTIACYDQGFLALAREQGLVPPRFEGGKKAVRDLVRAGPGGDVAWQQLQARLYGREIGRAQLAAGVDVLLRRARGRGIPIVIVSHKTRFSPFDSETDLRAAAMKWMDKNGVFDSGGMALDQDDVFFEVTRAEKMRRIATLGCTHFIDDLEEVFEHPDFPGNVRSYLYAANYDELPRGPYRAFRTFQEITDHLLGVDPLQAAAALTGRPSAVALPISKGGNNQLYRVCAGDSVFALKSYPCPDDDPRDRLGTEHHALSFLARQREQAVPLPIAMDRSLRVALYQWIEGDAIARPSGADVDAALSFLSRLHEYRTSDGALGLPPASEACLSTGELLRQLGDRRSKLLQVAAREPGLADFLSRLQTEEDRQCETFCADCNEELAREHRTLSPSDFGFHNALRDRGGRVVFFDFEYFGWDDPVKLTADFLLHPGMNLDSVLRRRFAVGMAEIHKSDADFRLRLARCLPLYALRWCFILLNEFLPDRRARRIVASGIDDSGAKARQLAKAEAMLSHFPDVCEDLP